MLTHLWKCYSAVHAALEYFFYSIFGFFPRIVPQFFRNFFSTREKPDDLEGCGRHLSKNDSPTIAKNNASGSAKEYQAVLSGEIADPVLYEPPFNKTLSQGSTSLIARVNPGVVVKYPQYSWWHSEAAENHPFVKDIKHNFEVKERLLDILGIHPRIIRYIGVSEEPRGLLFAEASDKNFLLHNDSGNKLDLLLCDFGGSTNKDIDSGYLPNSGFFNPCKPWVSTEAIDIFSLGSVFYTIITGYWPYKSPGLFNSMEEINNYEDRVDNLFASKRYPSVDGLTGGAVIQGCWTERYSDVGVLIQDQRVYISSRRE